MRYKRGLIPILQSIQAKLGYPSKTSLEYISNHLGVPLSTIYGVATSYHQFILEPPGTYVVQICMSTACYIRGNSENYKFLLNLLGIKPNGRTFTDGLFIVLKVRCLGCCSLAPVIKVNDEVYGKVGFNEIRTSYRSRAKVDNPKSR
ncbi:NAD(P)H-dependent oxidoreductase subunit E [Candidatus Bathyarchaeota archaeon]|nr:NAD(P)H-dependent oxidoreductase subunit E [Candidatus Bathyarchaeota archaeon]